MIIILTKENAVREWTELMGPVELELAKLAFPNSLRAQLDSTILKNQLHSSSSAKHAKDHIKLLFGDTLRDTFVLGNFIMILFSKSYVCIFQFIL